MVREFLIDSRPELMRSLALRVRDELESKDLAHGVYLRTMRLDQVRQVRNPRACLFRVALDCHGYDIELDLNSRIPT